ncbi:hypothetical protein [Singulisphaera sp. PoT]|uniref:hypothetical protein n=1 Tax=Singulisphaera sp. PoT TaxID=3411797 RepID=UPI003BF5AA28
MVNEVLKSPSRDSIARSTSIEETAPAAIRRVSWGAVLAGVTVTLVTQLLFGVLGIAIGASTIDPLHEASPTSGLGMGAGIWFIVTGVISLFAGGWTAGRLAGIPRAIDSSLHGVLTWGIATLAMFYLLTTTVGAVIGGTARALSQGASIVGQGVASASPQAMEAVKGEMKDRGIDLSSIKEDARTMLRQTGKPALQPEAIEGKAKEARDDARATAGTAATDPQAADQELNGLLDRLYNRSTEVANAADREAAVNVIVARTGKSKEEAGQVVDRWEKTYQQAKEQLAKTKERAAQKAREAGDVAARKVGHAAGWSFVAMLLGLGAAAYGGFMSLPTDLRTRVGHTVTTHGTR